MHGRKLLYVLLDGVGDRPDPALGGKTPLEIARTSALDSLASKGVMGSVYTVGRGIAPESDVAVFHMLGYKLGEDYPGRGVVEAVGACVEFRDGDLALRADFATVDPDFRVIDRRAGRNLSDGEAGSLSSALNGQVSLGLPDAKVYFKHTMGHRLIVHVRVENVRLSANITNTDPAYQRVKGMGVARTTWNSMKVKKAKPLDDTDEAKLAASIVNMITEESFRVLEGNPINERRRREGKLPANIVLMRDAGDKLPHVESLVEKVGLRMAAIADMPVEVGISRIVGMNVELSPRVDDYRWKAARASELLKSFDGVYVHLKGPDEPGHDGKPLAKSRSIESIDMDFFSPLLDVIDLEHTIVVVSADHATPCQLKAHSDDPVPVMVSGDYVESDSTTRFTEKEAMRGSLGILEGPQVLQMVIGRYFKE